MVEAYESGILSVNHRSQDFIDLSKDTIKLLKIRLAIPDDFKIFFISSATEAWEIISQEFIDQDTLHIYNGAFGQKWFEYAQKLRSNRPVKCFEFGLEEELPLESIDDLKDYQVICVTQNETSNATRIGNVRIKGLKLKFPKSLIAVDATSSMGGEALDFSNGDIWFASVQKCFGLPAGMALMICSPRTIERVGPCMESRFYNSLSFMNEMMGNWQTTYTPNVLSIFLLNRTLQQLNSINITSEKLVERSTHLYHFFSELQQIKLLVHNPVVRSNTVIALTASEVKLAEIKKAALEKGILLGNGYGKWKATTLRIANFPAHEDEEFELLKSIFTR